MSGQSHFMRVFMRSIVRAIPINRPSPESIVPTIPINSPQNQLTGKFQLTQPPKSITDTIVYWNRNCPGCDCIQSASAAAAVAALCLAILLLLLQQQCCCFLLVFGHRVPDGQIFCWFMESDSSVFFLFTQMWFCFDGTSWQYCVAFTASICLRPR